MLFAHSLPRFCRLLTMVMGLSAMGLLGCGESGENKSARSDAQTGDVEAVDRDATVETRSVPPGSATTNPAQVSRDPLVQDNTVSAPDPTVETDAPSTLAPAMDDGAEASTSPVSETIDSGEPSADVSGSGMSLKELLADVEVPPPWLDAVQTPYDTTKPWKEARLEIRRLLGVGQPETHREALKLTWVYFQNDDMGDGHEYPMYTFLGGEPLWSILAHKQFLAKPHENTPIHSHMTLASLYAQYDAFEEAKATLDVAMNALPDPPWKIMRRADLLVALGDLYAAWDQPDAAKDYYRQAAELYPTAKPPYGGHTLPRRAAAAQVKLDRLTLRSLSSTTLKDGEYRDTALGYAGDIHLTVAIDAGRIADIQVRHEEKIDQNACVLIPQWIVEKQTLQVDGISGATVTRDAIVNGTFRCLKKAGLK